MYKGYKSSEYDQEIPQSQTAGKPVASNYKYNLYNGYKTSFEIIHKTFNGLLVFKELEEIETTASKLLKEKLLQGTSIDALTASRQDEVKLKSSKGVESCSISC